MLVGFLAPTEGTAVVEGLDIRNEMDDIYQIMGACPQVRLRGGGGAYAALKA